MLRRAIRKDVLFLLLLGAGALFLPPLLAAEESPLPQESTAATALLPGGGETLWAKGDDASALLRRSRDYFRDNCDPAMISEKSSAFSLFSNKSGPIYAKCIDDLNRFAQTYPERAEAGEALWQSAELERARKNFTGEAIALAKVLHLYDDASLRSKAETRLLRVAADDLKSERKGLKSLAAAAVAKETIERHLQMLQQLAGLEGKDFLPLLRRECDLFLERYPKAPEAERVLALREETFFREKELSAYALGLRLLIDLYPDSQERLKRLEILASVQWKELREYKKAVSTYAQLLRDYPQTVEAETALLMSATICDEELQDYPRAIELLSLLVRDFPISENARTALSYQARIYAQRLKDPLTAIQTYRQLVKMFPGKPAMMALSEAATLARNPLQDYDEQILLQQELAKSYPESPEAVQALYEIAQTQEEKLKDAEAALKTYQQLIDLYPASNPLVEKARKRLEKAYSKSP